MSRRVLEFVVGLFMLAGLVALIALAFKVSGLTEFGNGNYYTVTANFDNIGGLKIRAPVSIAGVRIGQISNIKLNKNSFRAEVTLRINMAFNTIPIDSSASILTEGILGSNYIGISPGFEEKNLSNGGMIETTHSALVLENLIGQLIYSLKSGSKEKTDKSNNVPANSSNQSNPT